MTEFGDAGIILQKVGKQNFTHKVQIPWVYSFKREPNLISLFSNITEEFVILESTSIEGTHRARIIDNDNGTMLDIEIFPNKIMVYPTSNDHQSSSERIYNILVNHAGELK